MILDDGNRKLGLYPVEKRHIDIKVISLEQTGVGGR